jgi:hypothetical protein
MAGTSLDKPGHDSDAAGRKLLLDTAGSGLLMATVADGTAGA